MLKQLICRKRLWVQEDRVCCYRKESAEDVAVWRRLKTDRHAQYLANIGLVHNL